MTEIYIYIFNLDRSIQSELRLGNANKVCIKGRGVIIVYNRKGDKRKIDDVYYVPSLK